MSATVAISGMDPSDINELKRSAPGWVLLHRAAAELANGIEPAAGRGDVLADL